jgi:hypothetical protein
MSDEKTNQPKKEFKQPLSEKEISFIKEKIDEGWSDKKIAEEIKRSVPVVKKYRINIFGVKRDQAGNLLNYKPTESEEIQILEEKKKLKFKDEQTKIHGSAFISTPRGKKLEKILTEDNFLFFVDQWVQYHIQLEDMTPSEEDMLEKMIILNIRILDNQKNLKEIHCIQQKLRHELSGKDELDPENDKDLQILQTIESYNGQEIELNKEFVALNKEYTSIQDNLNTTRKQRESKEKIGSATFFDLIKKFNQEEIRNKEGRFAELMRMATSKKLDDWQKPIQYEDGNVDLPYLDGTVFKEKKIKEKEDNAKSREDSSNNGD